MIVAIKAQNLIKLARVTMWLAVLLITLATLFSNDQIVQCVVVAIGWIAIYLCSLGIEEITKGIVRAESNVDIMDVLSKEMSERVHETGAEKEFSAFIAKVSMPMFDKMSFCEDKNCKSCRTIEGEMNKMKGKKK